MKEAIALFLLALLVLPMLGAVRRLRRLPRSETKPPHRETKPPPPDGD